MKRREFIKGSLALGAAAVMPRFAIKKERNRMSMPDVKNYRIAFTDGTKKEIEFTHLEWEADGSANFYVLVQGSTDERFELRVSATGYMWMMDITGS